jgi:hypothetical protein
MVPGTVSPDLSDHSVRHNDWIHFRVPAAGVCHTAGLCGPIRQISRSRVTGDLREDTKPQSFPGRQGSIFLLDQLKSLLPQQVFKLPNVD